MMGRRSTSIRSDDDPSLLEEKEENDEEEPVYRNINDAAYVEEGSEVDPYVRAQFAEVGKIRRQLTVEPALIMYFMTFVPLVQLTQQYVLKQMYIRLNVSQSDNESVCGNTNVSSDAERQNNNVQAWASLWMVFFNLTMFLPGLISTPLLGSYSDHRGRKVGLLSPMMGGTLRCAYFVLVSALELPLEVMFAGFLVEGLSGGAACFFMAAFAYAADITTHKQRSARIFRLEVCLAVGTVTSQISIGYLLKTIGFTYCFIICAVIYLLNMLYVGLILIETRERQSEARLFNLGNIISTLRLFFKDNGENRRWKLLVALLLLFLSACVELGSVDNITYFQVHPPICFNSVQIGLWQATNYGVRFTGGTLAVIFLYRHVGDTGLIMISLMSGICFYVLTAFTRDATMMFIVTFGGIIYCLVTPMVRSLTSKFCTKDEQGAVFSGIGMVQTLAILTGDVTFNAIYAATIRTSQGLVFLIEAAILLIGLLLTVILATKMRREATYLRLKALT